MRFFNFFLNHMVQKYQNEIAPIFYYGISTKTIEKDLKIPILQPPDWKHPYWMTLYFTFHTFVTYTEACGKAGWSQEEEGDWVREDCIYGHTGRVEFTLYSYLNQIIWLFCLIVKRKSLTDKTFYFPPFTVSTKINK